MASALSTEDRIRLVQLFYANERSYSVVQRMYSTEKNIKRKTDAPSVQLISHIIDKFQESGCVNKQHYERQRASSSASRKAIDRAYEDLQTAGVPPSIRKISEASGSSYGTVQKHLRKDLHLYPYKVSIGQPLTEEHMARRCVFSQWMLHEIHIDSTFLSRIIWSDECSFHLDAWVNRQNLRFWGTQKPSDVVQQSSLSSKVNVWMGISSSFLIGPYFFEHEGTVATINSERYLTMMRDLMLPKLQQQTRFRTFIFQQDDPPPHVSRDVKQFLTDSFGYQKIISRGFPKEWPAQSPDLSPLDFWLWSFLKEKVYPRGKRPNSKEDLMQRIRDAVHDLSITDLQAAIENVQCRLEACIANEGAHFE